MTDYRKLIDDETRAFIERTNSFYPPDTATYGVDDQRAIYDRMCAAFHAGYPRTVTARTTAVSAQGHNVPVRTYRRDQPDRSAVIVYYHGGGFILGGLESHDDVCAELCDRTGFDVVSVDYRLSPEHKHPTAFDDAITAYKWVAANRNAALVVCGDSAGGNLAAAVSHAMRGSTDAPTGQVLIYPGLGGDTSRGSYVTHADAPMLTTRDIEIYGDIRGGEPYDPTAEPLADTDFAGLPVTVAITAECDPLSSDGETYRDRILAAGGKALWREEAGLVHGYLRARHSVERARRSFDRIVASLIAVSKGELPELD